MMRTHAPPVRVARQDPNAGAAEPCDVSQQCCDRPGRSLQPAGVRHRIVRLLQSRAVGVDRAGALAHRSSAEVVIDRLRRALLVAVVASGTLQAAPVVARTSALRAQEVGSTTGAIVGTIRDASGAVLRGVTVTISSEQLLGARTTTNGEEGFYRFPALPPGAYSLEFRHAGFKTIRRDGIYIGIGFTATVDVQLPLDTFQQSLTIVGGSTLIDRQSTAVSTNFTARQLSDLPTSRSMFGILSATPGVHVARVEIGGSGGDTGGQYAAYGTPGANRPMVEGISVSGISPTGFTLDFGSFEAVSVGTAAHDVEWPLPGVQMQFIVKSGGNQYHGSAYGDYENAALQSANIDEGQIARFAQGSARANQSAGYHDVNADVGGYITPDRAWWYFSFRQQDVALHVVNFPAKPVRTELMNYTAKTTYQIARNNKFIGFGQTGRDHLPNRLDPFGPAGGSLSAATAINQSEESTTEQVGWGWIWKGEWNSVISDRALFEVRFGEFGADRRETPHGTAWRFEDVGTLIVRGGNRHFQQTLRRDQVFGSFSYSKNGWFGTHSFKVGGEVFRNLAADIWRSSYPGDVLHVLRNEAPVEVYLFQAPSRSESGFWTYGAYGGDSWRVSRRLTLNLALRFDRYRVFLPAQSHPVGRFNEVVQTFAAVADLIDWNVFVPRLGASYDLTASGRSIVKFSAGQYPLAPGVEVGSNANPNASPWWRRYTWTDRNGNGNWDASEEGRLLDSRGGTALESVDPHLKLPLLTEVGAWFERELPGGVALRTGFVWRGERRHYLRQNAGRPFQTFSVPITIPDPGPDGRLATADDGRAIAGYEIRPELLGSNSVSVVRNVPQADADYWTWDLTVRRPLSRHWSLVAGFDHVWSHDQASAYFGQSVRQNAYPLTPNDLLNAGNEGQYEFRTWTAKVSGTYDGPWGLRITPSIRHQSGQPFGRTFTTSLNYGTVRILAEPMDTRRMDNLTTVDSRIEKGISLPGNRRVAGFVDLFNLFNVNPAQNVSWSSGTFLRPLNIVPPRIARFGLKLDW